MQVRIRMTAATCPCHGSATEVSLCAVASQVDDHEYRAGAMCSGKATTALGSCDESVRAVRSTVRGISGQTTHRMCSDLRLASLALVRARASLEVLLCAWDMRHARTGGPRAIVWRRVRGGHGGGRAREER